jgi:hypothetical protein
MMADPSDCLFDNLVLSGFKTNRFILSLLGVRSFEPGVEGDFRSTVELCLRSIEWRASPCSHVTITTESNQVGKGKLVVIKVAHRSGISGRSRDHTPSLTVGLLPLRSHPFPSRTRKLSLLQPQRRCCMPRAGADGTARLIPTLRDGRVGSRRDY